MEQIPLFLVATLLGCQFLTGTARGFWIFGMAVLWLRAFLAGRD